MKRVLTSLHSHRELFANLTLRELRLRYRNSVLGWFWSLLNPALLTVVYTVLFTQFLKVKPPPGDPSGIDQFAVFLLAALIPWNFFSGALTTGMTGLLNAGALIQKVRFPRELVVIAPVVALGVSLLIELGVLAVIVLLTGHFALHLLPFAALGCLILLVFSLGISLVLAALNLRYRDILYLTNIATLVLFYMTPILYDPSIVPSRITILGIEIPAKAIVEWNPLALFTEVFRNVFYDIRPPSITDLAVLTVVSGAIFAAGTAFFLRRAPHFPDEL